MNRSSRMLQMLALALAALLTFERGHCALMTLPAAGPAQAADSATATEPSVGHDCCAPPAPSKPRPTAPAPVPACPCIDLPQGLALPLDTLLTGGGESSWAAIAPVDLEPGPPILDSVLEAGETRGSPPPGPERTPTPRGPPFAA